MVGCGCSGDTGNNKVTATTVTEKYVTGVTVTEEYSLSGMVKDNQWTHIGVRFRAYEEYNVIIIYPIIRSTIYKISFRSLCRISYEIITSLL